MGLRIDDNYISSLYKELSSTHELGTPEEFATLLQTDDKYRKSLFDDASTMLDLGDYPTFESKVKKKESTVSYIDTVLSGETFSQAFLGSTEEKPLLPYKEKPTEYLDTLPEDITPTSVIKSGVKKSKYFQEKQTELSTKIKDELQQEVDKLREDFNKKKEQEGANKKQLDQELETKLNDLVVSKQKEAEGEIDKLQKGEYEYLEKGDVKNLQKQIQEIRKTPMSFDKKNEALQAIRDSFLSNLISMPIEYQEPVKREINDLFAKETLFDEKGNISVFGWKKEVWDKKNKLDRAVDGEISDIAKKYPGVVVNIPNIGNHVDMKKAGEYMSPDEFTKFTNLLTLRQKADQVFDDTLNLPDDGGDFWEGFKSQGKAMLTMGFSDLFKALDIQPILKKQERKEKLTSSEQAMVDAYGILETAQNSEEIDKWYKRGQGIGQSVAWMESFAATGGMGGAGKATTVKIIQNTIKNKFIKNIITGTVTSATKIPFLVGGYTEAVKRMEGTPKLTEQGDWVVDPKTIEPVIQSIAKGAYMNFAEALTETAGGWLAGTKTSKFIGKSLGITKIPKGVREVFNRVGMQPLGELPEEYLATLMETPVMGDQTLKEAFSWENIWETAVQVGLMSGFFSGIAAPSVVIENSRRGQNMNIINIFGKDNISNLRNAIENNDKEAFSKAIDNANMSLSGKSVEELGMSITNAQKGLIRYVNSIAVQKGVNTAQTATKIADIEEQDITDEQKKKKITEITDKGEEVTEIGALEVPRDVENQKNAEDIARKTNTSFIGTMGEGDNVLDLYNIKIGDQEATFAVPSGSKEDVVLAKRDETITKFKGGQDNAIQRSTGSSEISEESRTEKGIGTVEGVLLRDGSIDQGKTQGETRTGKEIKPVQETKPFTEREHKQNIERIREIEKIADENGYTFEATADLDPDMSSLTVYDKEGNAITLDKLPKGIKELADEYTNLMHEDRVSTDVEITPKEAISEEITPKVEEVPPTSEVPTEPFKTPKEPPERERAYLSRVHKAEKTSPRLQKLIEKHGLNYRVMPNSVSKEEADFLVAFNGLENMEKAARDMSNGMPDAVRAALLSRLIYHYDQLGIEAEKDGKLEEAQGYFEKALNVAVFTDATAQGAGRFIQYLGSEEVAMMLSPKRNVARVKKELRKQRNDKIAKNQTEIEDKATKLKDANKTSIEDTIKSAAYKAAKTKITKKGDTAQRPRISKEKIKKEQEYIKNQWDAFKKAGKTGEVSMALVGLTKEQIEAIGNIAGAYVRMGYYKVEDIILKIQEDFKKYVNQDVSAEDIRKILPTEIDGKPIDEYLTEKALEGAKDKLAGRIVKSLEDKKAPPNDPVKQMIDILFGKVREKDTKEKEKTVKKSAKEKIREALDKKSDYAQVWEDAKTEVQNRINNNAELSDEQKVEYTNRLQSFYDEIIGKPYTEKQVEEITRKGLEELGFAIDRIVRDHYTVQDVINIALQDKLVEELGLTDEDAKLLADAVDEQFRKIATARKLSILRRGMKPRDTANPKQSREEWRKLIELTNMGAFSDAEFAEAYADAWGFPKLTEEQAKELERLASRVYDIRTGFKQYEAVQDMLNYIAKLPGIDLGEVAMGVWYANVLSGARTQAKNFLGNAFNFALEYAVSVIKGVATGKFTLIPFITKGAGVGFAQGAVNFAYTMQTGYSPIRQGKIEQSNIMEQWKFKGLAYPLNFVKYVARFMIATDTFFYSGLKEFRAYELAMSEARKRDINTIEPSQSDWEKANEILGNTTQRRLEAEAQATEEGLKGNEYKKRVWEIMEEYRSETIVHESNNFASRGTYNYKPEGMLGLATHAISVLANAATISPKLFGRTYHLRIGKLLVPFTRIIANVGNTALDYTPIGLSRAAQGHMGVSFLEKHAQTKGFYRELTNEERWRIFTKSMIGLAAYTSLYLLSEPGDDGEEPSVTITASGFGGGVGSFVKNEELKKQPGGWQPYSIKRKNGKWFSYQYTPLFLILAPLGWLRDMQKYHKDKYDEMSLLDKISGSIKKGATAMADMTWMTTVAGFMEALSSPDEATFNSYMKKTGSSMIKGFVYPKFAEQLKQVIDETMDNPKKYSSSFWGKILKDTPILTNKFPVQYNAFGEPVIFDSVQMIESMTTDDPYAKYLATNLYSDGKTLGTPNQKEKANMIYDDKTQKERAMNDFEYMDFVRESALRIKERITNELMSNTNLSKEEIQKEITSIISESRRIVKEEMFGWGEFRMKNPNGWQKLMDNRAVQIPAGIPKEGELSSTVKWMTDEGEVKATAEEVRRYNKKAMDYYYDSFKDYLAENPDKTERDEVTNEFIYIQTLKVLWQEAKDAAKGDIIDEREKTNK